MTNKTFLNNDRKCMAVEEFEFILNKHILPLIQTTGKLQFKDECINHKLKKYVLCSEEKIIYFYPTLNTPQFYFYIKTNNNKQELGAAENILREIMNVSSYDNSSSSFKRKNKYLDNKHIYRNSLFNVAVEVGLCQWLGSKCIYDLVQRLREWSQKTYEGNHMSFGFIIDSTKNTHGKVDYLHFLGNKHSAVFTDGVCSSIKLDNDGQIIKYFSTTNSSINIDQNKIPWTPYEYVEFANMCVAEGQSNWIGIIMQANGDMLVFKNKTLVFVKCNGKWMYLNSFNITNTLSCRYSSLGETLDEALKKDFTNNIYLSILDASFARKGACIAILDDKHVSVAKEKCFWEDSLDNNKDKTGKKKIIKRLIRAESKNEKNQYFQNLDRKLRLELLSLDGATVLDSTGKILCAGAIVKVKGGSEGGGRLAATKALAQYGLAIKISADGGIECYSTRGSQKAPRKEFEILT